MKNSAKSDSAVVSRRTVFAGAGTVGALAAAAAVLPAAQAPDVATVKKPPLADGQPHGRYELTAHVQRYYRTAKV